MEKTRLNWDDYYLNLLPSVGLRATCDRGRSGCIIVDERNRIIATGYVRSPPGLPHCDDVGHDLIKVYQQDGSFTEHCIRTTHGEINCLLNATKDPKGGTLYCSMTPCKDCCKAIITAGIKRVVCLNDYQASSRSKEMFINAKVELVLRDETVTTYPSGNTTPETPSKERSFKQTKCLVCVTGVIHAMKNPIEGGVHFRCTTKWVP